ncbi:hypothetical protein ACP70R_045504 [Stipagrostis hirtigluma subsp. patula]
MAAAILLLPRGHGRCHLISDASSTGSRSAPRLPLIQAAAAAMGAATGTPPAPFPLCSTAAIDSGRHRHGRRCQGHLQYRFSLRRRSTPLPGTRSRTWAFIAGIKEYMLYELFTLKHNRVRKPDVYMGTIL